MTRRRIGRSIIDALAGLPLFETAPLNGTGTFIGERVNVGRGKSARDTRDEGPQHPGEMESRCLTRR